MCTVPGQLLLRFLRRQGQRPLEVARHLQELEDPQSAPSRLWDREHDRNVAQRLLELIEPDFDSATWRA